MIERRKAVPTSQDVINWTGGAIAVLLMFILAFVTYALVRWTIPTENENPLMFLLGQLTGMVTMVVAFYFGGSSTAKKQTDTIDTLAKTAQAVAPATPDKMVIAPGESATTTSTEAGTVIQTDPPPGKI